MYHSSENTIKNDYLAKQLSISFQQDSWTAPNVTAFMAITAHFIDEDFKMQDLMVAVPHFEGEIFIFFIIINVKY